MSASTSSVATAMGDAQHAVELADRASYGRLLAYLSSETRDVAGAEDALGEALLDALTRWRIDGLPKQPEAWLLTAARHRLIDQTRCRRVRDHHQESPHRDEFFANLARLFSEREIVDLTAPIAHENYNAKSNRPLRVEANNFCPIAVPQPKA
jgi:DNA-directed RNA polymerase specialized sigma24 family protein